jgi:hypothetical protein
MNFSVFASPRGERSLLKGIPMCIYSKSLMKEIRAKFGPCRVKFRGPRPVAPGRSIITRRATCLKKDAITFTVYLK